MAVEIQGLYSDNNGEKFVLEPALQIGRLAHMNTHGEASNFEQQASHQQRCQFLR